MHLHGVAADAIRDRARYAIDQMSGAIAFFAHDGRNVRIVGFQRRKRFN